VQKEMLGCFTHSEAEQYKGTRQYPDPDAVGDHYSHHHHQQQQQHIHSSGSVPVHHLQHPGLPVEKVVSLPAAAAAAAAAAAGTVAGDAAGTTNAVACKQQQQQQQQCHGSGVCVA